ncbi:unnamed protein product [Rodentolepis nana]|uniref:Ephrin_rec_like domain-containing protein n=1 Tax=Rodentolepis nana TaxID=102285 RepID=A0A0R3TXE0_RODNA|nr:unnamed protein product [Rodentolepis nana]
MILPETPAGHDAEVREVQGHCVVGAEPTIASQSEVNQFESSNQSQGLKPSFCKANGQWHILQDNVCECLPGYESSVEENLCSSCPMGTYKSLHATGFCRPCPPNSTSEASIASKRCVCNHPLYVWQTLANDGSGICSLYNESHAKKLSADNLKKLLCGLLVEVLGGQMNIFVPDVGNSQTSLLTRWIPRAYLKMHSHWVKSSPFHIGGVSFSLCLVDT